jgi:Holliday junction resolvase
MSNPREIGANFELAVMKELSRRLFWAYRIPSTAIGQPADIIAVRAGRAVLIDCKYCKHDRFVLSRIEGNQETSMDYWEKCRNGSPWFAFGFEDDSIVFVSWQMLKMKLEEGVKSLNKSEIIRLGVSIGTWDEVMGYGD